MAQPQMICANCGLRGIPKSYTRGNTYIKVMTWPLSTFARYEGCPRCRAANMVPLNSPRGEELTRVAEAFEAAHPRTGTLKPGDEVYYSEGWFVRPDDGSPLGPFLTREEAETAERKH